ncbi:hypothetical protein EUGRSUZ_D01602 [Eucalyptus grandis]|uniref:Uncharacterized protein n=2 Tax=Eucalyptus grandis TaxID=71139 RepID=A0ACC3KWM3_EUCGR|nr:hypothetical protein EUGRSUZ_D01602 [Eucalyptus grandis]
MMLGVVRRRVASGGGSASVSSLGQALLISRSAGSARRIASVADERVVLSRGCGPVRSFCHLAVMRCSVGSRPTRVVAFNNQAVEILPQWRLFSTESGDLVDAVVPFMGESITDGTLAKFLKNPGDRVELDEPIAQIETDKVTIDVASPEAGVIQKFLAKEGETVEPGTKIAVISKSGEGATHVAPSESAGEKAASPPPPAEKVEEKQKPKAEAAPAAEKPKAPSPPPPPPPKRGLQNQPIINAVIDGDDIIYRDYVDISIAVGTPKGLVVPVIRNAENMNFADIEKEINTLAKKANDGSISIDEMAGGTFTISNGGVYGSLLSTPIINPPQSAILGMHSIVSRPMVVGGNVVPRPMMYIALTYDHRLIDGREAVFFLRRIKDVVEDPRRLLLDI